MAASRIGPVCLALCLASLASACETQTVYEPTPAAKLVSHVTAQRPRFSVGDEFWFHIDNTSIVAEEYEGSQNGLHAFRRPLQHLTIYYTRDMSRVRVDHAFGDDEIFEPDDGELEFPLELGKTWTRTYRVRTESTVFATERTRDCKVMDFGQVKSQAGEFFAFRIACTQTELGRAEVTQEEVLYAPAVGRIVNRRSLGSGTTLNLIEYTRAPAS